MNNNEESRNMSFPNGFDKTNALFDFDADAFNNMGGTSLVGDMSDAFQPSSSTLGKRKHSMNLKLERDVKENGKIPISIAQGWDKSISSHIVCFSCTINMLTQDTFPTYFLKWANVTLEYIELVNGDFIDPTLARFVEHRMLGTWKEFRGENHHHFKKFNDPKQACANPPSRLALPLRSLRYSIKQSMMKRAARAKQPNNYSSGSKSFLQQQHELTEKQGLDWRPRPKSRKTVDNSSSSSYEEAVQAREVIELKAHLDNAHECIAQHTQAMKKIGRRRETGIHSAYTAVEVVPGGEYDGKMVDVWSCATLYVMLVAAYPFDDSNDFENSEKTIKRIMGDHYKIVDHIHLS
ncbi:CACTA en-spm transposon protein [Cucumis melo var. makuwa]|uniref:CACTA en-spm transposon protein n=1 Tax=Cucumis melo var. makuwa TaxID=1194695 RepID=A0A5D3C9H4_CUCMM|nr:CACTA en-spm transposon protein [Cucumis melo var. makuwa]TYK07980.1 CACTA en-spm transposon protein [Cucumis melo var. makuwa]